LCFQVIDFFGQAALLTEHIKKFAVQALKANKEAHFIVLHSKKSLKLNKSYKTKNAPLTQVKDALKTGTKKMHSGF